MLHSAGSAHEAAFQLLQASLCAFHIRSQMMFVFIPEEETWVSWFDRVSFSVY